MPPEEVAMPLNPESLSTLESPERKLVAILSADVFGYSSLMGRDEAGTVITLSEYRSLICACVERCSGKIDDAKGDAILAEFPSAVNAVSCAVEIQRQLAERNAALPDARRMLFRIGINLGDVIVRDNTVYGDGVNIAARIEAIAAPGGICISRMVYDHVKSKLSFTYEALGRKALKNIPDPVEVFRVLPPSLGAGAAGHTTRRGAIALVGLVLLAGAGFAAWRAMQAPSTPGQWNPGAQRQLPDAPSIAVLPFSNMSGKPEDDWFSDGMTETLITDLSRLNNLFVVARNSSFAYKGKPLDVRRVGEELGVRYVLEGSVQRTGERLRVNAQLIDAQTGRHLWAERYDRKLADIFEIQDDITQRIVTELDVKFRPPDIG
jgi:TolB-like protein/class 3 adenylate cyclase